MKKRAKMLNIGVVSAYICIKHKFSLVRVDTRQWHWSVWTPPLNQALTSQVDSDVSVVGVGYHGQVNPGLTPSNSNTDIKMMQVTSPLLSVSSSSSSIAVLPSKFSSNVTTPERNKSHRG